MAMRPAAEITADKGLCDEAILARSRRGTGARVARSAFLAWAALTGSQGQREKVKNERASGEPVTGMRGRSGRESRVWSRESGEEESRSAWHRCGPGVVWRAEGVQDAGKEPTTSAPETRQEFLLFLDRASEGAHQWLTWASHMQAQQAPGPHSAGTDTGIGTGTGRRSRYGVRSTCEPSALAGSRRPRQPQYTP